MAARARATAGGMLGLAALLLAASSAQGSARPATPSTVSAIRAVPRTPDDPLRSAGTRSVGEPSDGFLVDSTSLPATGNGFRRIPSFGERGLHFATNEMVSLVGRVAARVADAFPDSVLEVGNLSGKFGGPIRYSRSHQSGRDVDLAFYAKDEDGNPVLADGLLRFRCSGRARDHEPMVRFDDARNWALVEALLEDTEAPVQLIFVHPCLERRMLAHARAIGVSKRKRDRAAAVLRAAGRGSYPHDDHFHVRLFCSWDDLVLGCRDGGRSWPWLETASRVLARQAKQLGKVLRRGNKEERMAALQAVVELDLKTLAGRVARLLYNSDSVLRLTAANAVAALGEPGCLGTVRRALLRTRDPETALAILDALAAFEGPAYRTASLLRTLAGGDLSGLALRPEPELRRKIRVRALRALGFVGSRGDVSALIRALDTDDREVVDAARHALAFLTNRTPPTTETGDAARSDWRAWWETRRRSSWDRILAEGFRANGADVPRALYAWAAVQPLMDLIDGPSHVSYNAQQVLRRFAGTNAPRVPHQAPSRAAPVWMAWLGSRLPVGALEQADADTDEPPQRREAGGGAASGAPVGPAGAVPSR